MWMRRWQPRALAIAELAAVTMSLCFLGTPHGAFAQALVRSEASHRPRLADSTEARALASSDSSNSSRAHHVMVGAAIGEARSEEHTSELQSHSDLVCRLLLEKKKNPQTRHHALS